ncbi:MAG: molybdate ABC transporter substrate-binding protein [Paracoccaceae bacterium]
MQYFRAIFSGLFLFFTSLGGVRAETAIVAVAANFLTTAEIVGEAFTRDTGHEIQLVSGSTGKLYAQIVNGAPFDVFLAADAARPAALEKDGLVARRMPYAFGQLVLLVRGRREASLEAISDDRLRIAIADPDLAPYGLAARQVLGKLRGSANWNGNLVYGEDIGQTMSFIASRNADAALVALSQMPLVNFRSQELLIPADLYEPIRQEAVLLERATSNAAARGFFEYLDGPVARGLIKASGYGILE